MNPYMSAEQRQQLVKDLRESADLIERNGWTQGAFWRAVDDKPAEECPVCSLGAIYTTTSGHPDGGSGSWDVIQRFVAVKVALHDYLNEIVIYWNDKDDQTAEEVIRTFRLVADKVESGEAFE